VYCKQGRYEEALEMHSKALNMTAWIATFSGAALVADTKENIGLVYEKTGKKSEAKTLFTEVAEIRRAKLGPDHPDTKRAERLAAQ